MVDNARQHCSEEEHSSTHPRYLAIQEAMKDMLVRQDRMACEPVQERLQHPLPSSNHRRVLLRLRLLDRIVADRLLRRYRGDDERRVQLREAVPQRLELGVPVVRLGVLCGAECDLRGRGCVGNGDSRLLV